MTQSHLSELRLKLAGICEEVALFIKDELDKVSKNEVETKDLNSLVSYVDKEAENKLVSALSELLPSAGFITEENTVAQAEKALTWIIDPLDGTTNYLYKIPHFAISVALMEKNQPIVACVYDIMQKTAFTAHKNGGAWAGTKQITVSNRPKHEALVVTGFPYKRNSFMDERLAVLKYCLLNYRGVRRLGSAALDLAYVAAGRFDIYYENALNIWDLAAGVLLVEEAGGTISDYKGSQSHLQLGEVVASSPSHHSEIRAEIAKYLK